MENDGRDIMGEAVTKLQEDVGELKEWRVGISTKFEFFEQNLVTLTKLLERVTEGNEQSKEMIRDNKEIIRQNEKRIEIAELESKNSLKLCQEKMKAEIKAVEVKSDINDIKQNNVIENISRSDKVKAWWNEDVNKIKTLAMIIAFVFIMDKLGLGTYISSLPLPF